MSLITETVKGSNCRNRYGGRVLERHVDRLERQFIFAGTPVLGKSTTAQAENLVARFELGYVPTNRFDLSGYIHAYSRVFGFAQTSHYAKEEWRSEEPVNWIDRSRANF